MKNKNIDFDSKEYLAKVDAWWRAANYISVGQMYLKNNPLLKTELKAEDVKVYPIGHWGTIPGQNFIYAHLNRLINKYDLNMFYIEGPGHGGQVMVANSYLDGSYTELFPKITQDEAGMKQLFKIFSFPGGTASHAAPETPGSLHEGGELGYSLSHATGAILDNPSLIAATVVGDGEAETGPLMAGWFSNTFINPKNDGVVLPIVHLNGGKISNPTIFSRRTNEELTNLFKGFGWEPIFVEVEKVEDYHQEMANKLDYAIEKIMAIKAEADKKSADEQTRPEWPMIIFRSPKGWTGPKQFGGNQIEGSFRAHQVPIPVKAEDPTHLPELKAWLESYRPHEIFDENGKIKPEFYIAPKGNKRMAMNPATNGGIDPKDLVLGNWEDFAIKFDKPGTVISQDMANLGSYYAQLMKLNPTSFRVFGPDETKSNRLFDCLKHSKRQWLDRIDPLLDENLGPAGRIIDSQLSEHQAEGFLEGYVLTGRHGIFASYEAFLRVVDSMITQHLKWINKCKPLDWRNDLPSLNLIATSNAFQQDHNGYTHQDPGLLGHLADKNADVVREYLPADTNTLLAVSEKAFAEKNVINVIVASKQPREQFFTVAEAKELVEKGYKVIDWASNVSADQTPDLVVAASGTESTIEALAAISILNKQFPELKIRFVNVVEILKLRHPSVDSRGLTDEEFDKVFTKDKPVLFAFHGYESLLRDIFFTRHNRNLLAHGYREHGDITTSFDIRQLSQMDRFHMSISAAKAVYGDKASSFIKKMDDTLAYHTEYIREHGTDIDEVKNWKWEGIK
ncbi:phosphoketolase family protein [Mycoplasma sp. ES3157-GEN-MYC]|uniref:phosphoketolase family protein n=1 Tax=Mycoplasma miroungigenitalium TaxID=754515 RepID=UPI001C10754A|nr:phosphoketolase family protein [Mycoplasma miroungigenitalium]MBU4690559.1 phosphoketolase family protein [Mycoplasma miroungigenitalium]MBU4691826.1 phosphoketolase family protein [Mycoplasma miroungigenitalium]